MRCDEHSRECESGSYAKQDRNEPMDVLQLPHSKESRHPWLVTDTQAENASLPTNSNFPPLTSKQTYHNIQITNHES